MLLPLVVYRKVDLQSSLWVTDQFAGRHFSERPGLTISSLPSTICHKVIVHRGSCGQIILKLHQPSHNFNETLTSDSSGFTAILSGKHSHRYSTTAFIGSSKLFYCSRRTIIVLSVMWPFFHIEQKSSRVYSESAIRMALSFPKSAPLQIVAIFSCTLIVLSRSPSHSSESVRFLSNKHIRHCVGSPSARLARYSIESSVRRPDLTIRGEENVLDLMGFFVISTLLFSSTRKEVGFFLHGMVVMTICSWSSVVCMCLHFGVFLRVGDQIRLIRN